MDFAVVGLDNNNVGLVCSSDTNHSFAAVSSAATDSAAFVVGSEISNKQQKLYGSGFLKQGRSGVGSEDDLRTLKVRKIDGFDDLSASKSMQRAPLLRSSSYTSSSNLFSEGGQQMLSFSSPNSQTVTLPFYQPSSNAYARNAVYDNGGLNAGIMQGLLSGTKGPFTPSQWMELEHQVLIYKYIIANAPVPSYLLTPIRKALDSAGFSSFVGLRPVTYGWSGFHLGFSNSTDPEPGRCRRTDGKKWRCSRDAVADHKYCERHMNRGRHRSRKPVEGQSGHSLSGTKDNVVKQMPTVSSSSAAVVPGGGASNTLGLPTHQQLKKSLPCASSQSTASASTDRNYLEKENLSGRHSDITGLSMISPSLSLKDNNYPFSKQTSFQDFSTGEFGQVWTGSLHNPFDKGSSLVNCNNYGTSEGFDDSKSKSNDGLRQLFVDWPNSQSEPTWPENDLRADRTQLSISIPMAASDFMSSTSSPTNEKFPSSPLRLSRDLEATHMGLGVGIIANDLNRREANWIPISWESSMGGPLGEVLHSTNNSSSDGKIPSALNLMTEGWDGSPRIASSPTGVLHKATFVSLSNSSAGSSPRADSSRAYEGSGLCSTVLGSTLTDSALPTL